MAFPLQQRYPSESVQHNKYIDETTATPENIKPIAAIDDPYLDGVPYLDGRKQANTLIGCVYSLFWRRKINILQTISHPQPYQIISMKTASMHYRNCSCTRLLLPLQTSQSTCSLCAAATLNLILRSFLLTSECAPLEAMTLPVPMCFEHRGWRRMPPRHTALTIPNTGWLPGFNS